MKDNNPNKSRRNLLKSIAADSGAIDAAKSLPEPKNMQTDETVTAIGGHFLPCHTVVTVDLVRFELELEY